LADRPLAERFSQYIEGREALVVSSIQVYEVYRVVRRDVSEERAVEAVSALQAAEIVPVDDSLALDAADISLDFGLAMADAIIYTTAQRLGATLVTSDADFEGLPGVVIIS
jgi:predicted nucleic acid-binding protein